MNNNIYQIVYSNHVEYLNFKELKEKYSIIGFNNIVAQREELQGSPRLKGFLGAMWGGYKDNKPILRYETQEAYNMLSV